MKHGKLNVFCKVLNCRLAPLTILLVMIFGNKVLAQLPFTTMPEKTETRNGNKAFKKGAYTDAEAAYKKALDKKNNMPEAIFNLGDAVYEQKRFDEAAKQFQLSGQTNADKSIKAKAYHNLGNTFLEQQKWEEAAQAYKAALKQNPKDADTKYNLAYANARLKQQQQQGGGQDNKENKQDKKDDKKDQQNNQNQNENQDKNKNQQADNKEEDKKDGQQKQGQQPKLSKEEAEKILQAIQNEEQKTNQKVQQKQMKVVPVKIEKDW